MRKNMMKVWLGTFFAMSLIATMGMADDKAKPADTTPKKPTKEELFAEKSVNKVSEMYGYLISKGIENPILKLNFDAVMKGMQIAKNPKSVAPMSEQEYEETIGLMQEYGYQDLAAKNLTDADKFMQDNVKKETVKVIEPGKLQYEILQEGKGDLATEDTQTTIKYTGKYLDGTVFGTTDTAGGSVTLFLKQTIPGFRKGIVGMKTGEKRRLYIHPQLGYGTSGQLLPNALLIFDVEVVDVKPAPQSAQKDQTQNQNPTQQKAAAGQNQNQQKAVGQNQNQNQQKTAQNPNQNQTPQKATADQNQNQNQQKVSQNLKSGEQIAAEPLFQDQFEEEEEEAPEDDEFHSPSDSNTPVKTAPKKA
jgi:peptidylprolyl isomerase